LVWTIRVFSQKRHFFCENILKIITIISAVVIYSNTTFFTYCCEALLC
jgi:hypothetical protein